MNPSPPDNDDLESPPGTEVSDQPADELEDDGLAPEAGGRRPSLLSLLLLLAGAVWIIVALIKISGRSDEAVPPLAVGESAGASELPDLDDTPEPAPAEPDTDPQQAPQEPNSSETGPVSDRGEDASEPETPANQRGPPAGSLLVGKRWPQDYTAPEVVEYTIKRGGSMKVVANLYKIFHHEIESLNPGVGLERELPASTKITVYRHNPAQASESIDYAGAGSVIGAMPMVDGPGRVLKHIPWKGWATRTTVATLDLVLREWARRYPDRQPILVGNMSARNGGKLKPHSSHQSGRDADLSYPQIWDGKEELNWRKMNAQNLDCELTWALLELLRETGAMEVVFIDSKLQKLLYDHAIANQRYTKAELAKWMEYPRSPGSGSPLIQHHRGHEDHIHIRFKCTAAEARCKSR